MNEAIKYINFSGDYDKFYEWRLKTKAISIHKSILNYLKKSGRFPVKNMQKTMEIN